MPPQHSRQNFKAKDRPNGHTSHPQDRPHSRQPPRPAATTPATPAPAPTPLFRALAKPAIPTELIRLEQYRSNMRALKIRDKSVLDIVYMFPFVSTYHYQDGRWVRYNVDGPLVIFERSHEPRYGYIILNRLAGVDALQSFSAEDKIYTGQNTGFEGDSLLYKAVGTQHTSCFWNERPNQNEPMLTVFQRVLDCVKRNESYPPEFHYFREAAEMAANMPASGSESDSLKRPGSGARTSSESGAASDGDIDRLFSQLLPKSQQSVTVAELLSPAKSPPVADPPSGPLTGQNLLASMFASAASPSPNSTQRLGTVSEIHSPTPTTGPSLMSTLLGRARASPASSASSHNSYTVPTGPIRPNSGYEGSAGSSSDPDGFDDVASVTSAGLNGNFTNGTSRPFISVPQSQSLDTIVLGDATPRPPLHSRLAASPPPHLPSRQFLAANTRAPPSSEHSNGRVAKAATPPVPSVAAPVNYSRATSLPSKSSHPISASASTGSAFSNPLDSRTLEVDDDDDEVVVLNFEDTSVLSDPSAFDSKSRSRSVSSAAPDSTPVVAAQDGAVSTGKRVRTKRKKGKGLNQSMSDDVNLLAALAPSPSPIAVSALTTAQQYVEVDAVSMKGKQRAVSNGTTHANGVLDQGALQSAVLAVVMPNGTDARVPPGLSKNDFIREVLTLIHTDKSFVESLWHAYISRA